MLSFDTNSLRVKNVHRLMGHFSAFFWWSAILMMLVHFVFCFMDRTWAATGLFAKSFVKNEIILLVLISGRWVLQATLYFLFGRAIIKSNMKQLIVIAIVAIVTPIIRLIILRTESVNYVWDIACWVMVLYWIGGMKLSNKYGTRSMSSDHIMLLICFAGIFVRSYYRNAETTIFADALSICSFILQDMLRSFAMICFGVWLITLPNEDVE
jgi:hypothetical protein